MANFLQTFRELLAKAGLSETTETVAKLLQSEQVKALEGVEIDASISNILAQKLITLEGAKSHGDVSAHFKKSYFGAIDSALKTSLQELGIPDDTIAEIEKNPTDKRVSEALKKAIEIKGKSTNNQEIETLRNTLQTFKDSAKAEKETQLAETQRLQNELKSTHTNFAMRQSLAKYQFTEALNSEQIALLMQTEIQKELAKRKAILHHENGLLNLKSQENPEMDYFDVPTGKVLSYEEFLDSIVANSKLQKVNDAAQGNQGQNQNYNGGAGGQLTDFQKMFMGTQSQS